MESICYYTSNGHYVCRGRMHDKIEADEKEAYEEGFEGAPKCNRESQDEYYTFRYHNTTSNKIWLSLQDGDAEQFVRCEVEAAATQKRYLHFQITHLVNAKNHDDNTKYNSDYIENINKITADKPTLTIVSSSSSEDGKFVVLKLKSKISLPEHCIVYGKVTRPVNVFRYHTTQNGAIDLDIDRDENAKAFYNKVRDAHKQDPKNVRFKIISLVNAKDTGTDDTKLQEGYLNEIQDVNDSQPKFEVRSVSSKNGTGTIKISPDTKLPEHCVMVATLWVR